MGLFVVNFGGFNNRAFGFLRVLTGGVLVGGGTISWLSSPHCLALYGALGISPILLNGKRGRDVVAFWRRGGFLRVRKSKSRQNARAFLPLGGGARSEAKGGGGTSTS
jgi:hypothetical protein